MSTSQHVHITQIFVLTCSVLSGPGAAATATAGRARVTQPGLAPALTAHCSAHASPTPEPSSAALSHTGTGPGRKQM